MQQDNGSGTQEGGMQKNENVNQCLLSPARRGGLIPWCQKTPASMVIYSMLLSHNLALNICLAVREKLKEFCYQILFMLREFTQWVKSFCLHTLTQIWHAYIKKEETKNSWPFSILAIFHWLQLAHHFIFASWAYFLVRCCVVLSVD